MLTDEQRVIMRAWAEDLEDGGHHQITTMLHLKEDDWDGYCCLGRLCELAVGHVPLEVHEHPASDYTSASELSGDHKLSEDASAVTYATAGRLPGVSYPPEAVAEWSGLDPEAMSRYATMNDQDAATFHEIAARIRLDHDLGEKGK